MPTAPLAALIVPALFGAGAAMAIDSTMSKKSSGFNMSSPTSLPQPPTPDAAMAKAQDMANRKRASMTQTVFTNPLGVAGQADVARKTLLGQ